MRFLKQPHSAEKRRRGNPMELFSYCWVQKIKITKGDLWRHQKICGKKSQYAENTVKPNFVLSSNTKAKILVPKSDTQDCFPVGYRGPFNVRCGLEK